MRTTLDIDDDLLLAAKEIARRERITAGHAVSRMLRQSLTGAAAQAPAGRAGHAGGAGFVPVAAGPGVVVTSEQVERLREAEGI